MVSKVGNKYNATRVAIDGITFHSRAEAARYSELHLMAKAGTIKDLRLQVPYKIVVNGKNICTYRADFVYKNASGKEVVEDVKGYRTDVYRLKKKLVEAIYGIDIVEIEK